MEDCKMTDTLPGSPPVRVVPKKAYKLLVGSPPRRVMDRQSLSRKSVQLRDLAYRNSLRMKRVWKN